MRLSRIIITEVRLIRFEWWSLFNFLLHNEMVSVSINEKYFFAILCGFKSREIVWKASPENRNF